MLDFVYEHPVLTILVAILIILLVGAIWHDVSEGEAFMRECVEDGRKNYECTAMWRAGKSDRATVVPVPIVVR